MEMEDGEMMFDRAPKRLDQADMVYAAVQALYAEGYTPVQIEDALIRQAPTDLDLLAECYQLLFGADDRQQTIADQAA
ncbi:hypothetical protein VSX64_18650 [Aurantimonas sp. C2-6-R+9]|uniref:Uncharacterized protein n=1 Tax=Aurantimonas coralicida TaxID=182270 RepID=A0A9C9NDN6_9HYPH|nr:hypothetical protein [Aurantimonas sp. C2-6-R+9]HDZ72393.1 hypothetical protein [Aurantimonas coralicida]HEU00155.1 hypothetical protein [Aurantimonas coralicida]